MHSFHSCILINMFNVIFSFANMQKGVHDHSFLNGPIMSIPNSFPDHILVLLRIIIMCVTDTPMLNIIIILITITIHTTTTIKLTIVTIIATPFVQVNGSCYGIFLFILCLFHARNTHTSFLLTIYIK